MNKEGLCQLCKLAEEKNMSVGRDPATGDWCLADPAAPLPPRRVHHARKVPSGALRRGVYGLTKQQANTVLLRLHKSGALARVSTPRGYEYHAKL